MALFRNKTVKVYHMNRGDAQWLIWGGLCLGTLTLQAIFMAVGVFDNLNRLHTELLRGAPFYLTEAGATAGSLLSPIGAFALSIPLTLYGTVVLSMEKSLKYQWLLTALAMLAVCLSSLLCTLWDKLLHTAPLLSCLLTMQLLIMAYHLTIKHRA